MHHLIFALAAAGFLAGSISWLSTAYYARRRARALQHRGLDTDHWHSLAAKDGLAALLFLCLSVVAAAEAVEDRFSSADPVLSVALVPLALSLVWTRRFARTVRVAAAESAVAQREREGQDQATALTERLSVLLDAEPVRTTAGTSLRTFYRPTEGIVGGDFLGAVSEGDEILFTVGDVTGHGLEAGVDALRVKDLILTAVLAGEALSEALRLANIHLCAGQHSESLVSAFVGCYRRGELRYASAGHLPGLLFGPALDAELGPTGMILGVSSNAEWTERQTCFPPGHRLLVYTDGLVEAYGHRGGLDRDEIKRVALGGELDALGMAVEEKRPAILRDDIAALELARDEDDGAVKPRPAAGGG